MAKLLNCCKQQRQIESWLPVLFTLSLSNGSEVEELPVVDLLHEL